VAIVVALMLVFFCVK